MDVWNGAPNQVDAQFRLNTGTTYPLLLKGSSTGRLYGFDRHNYAVIDHNGVLRYRSAGTTLSRFDNDAIQATINVALKELQAALVAAEEELTQAQEQQQEEMNEDNPPTENPSMQDQTENQPAADSDMQMEDMDITTEASTTEIPDHFSLDANFPNPFNSATTIRFTLPQASPVQLSIYNITGHLVAKEHTAVLPTGTHILSWDARGLAGERLASGVYFYRLETTTTEQTRKMLFLQ